ncbi:MAG: LOG family protein [unclassified Hahellaceae]|nr:LOG family protein [Hahellaceae bacterium]|tara:strand:+ start:27868 stop:29277 length:1410 start_codon:yes stop_codon:yes gene_type:complete
MQKVTARITPEGSMDLLSQAEVEQLRDTSQGGLHQLFRNCALAVLNSGELSDNPHEIERLFHDFDIQVIQQPRGIKLELINAPASAFVDGKLVLGIKEQLYAVLRDVVYAHSGRQIFDPEALVPTETQGAADTATAVPGSAITNGVFDLLRNAGVLVPRRTPNLVVCWGGHSISREEYDFTKEVGHSLGIRGFDICTGCGPGAMKGPMKGATIAHAKQRIRNGRYLGVTEPGIIAAESPNPIVNELVILPDIEKRLEAFVRIAHSIIVFPGGAGTAEEILYLLGVLLNPRNAKLPFPLIFSGNKASESYFRTIDDFIQRTLGPEATRHYKIIIDDPEQTAREVRLGIQNVTYYRKSHGDAFYFNWLLSIDEAFQIPFIPTHQSMAALELHREQPLHLLAANLRRAFSGIVAGNVKADGIRQIMQHGPFRLKGDRDLVSALGSLLEGFVEQQRMKLPGSTYEPCYTFELV